MLNEFFVMYATASNRTLIIKFMPSDVSFTVLCANLRSKSRHSLKGVVLPGYYPFNLLVIVVYVPPIIFQQ